MLRVLLDQIGEPCWVVDASGKVRISNVAAKSAHPVPPAYLASIGRGEGDEFTSGVRIRRVTLDDEVWTIVFHLREDRGVDTARLFGLDANDAEIVDHVASGFSDRELVLLTGRPITTIQTSIVRIFRAIGVSNRSELVAAIKRARIAHAAVVRNPTGKSEAVPRNPSVLVPRTGTSDEQG